MTDTRYYIQVYNQTDNTIQVSKSEYIEHLENKISTIQRTIDRLNVKRNKLFNEMDTIRISIQRLNGEVVNDRINKS